MTISDSLKMVESSPNRKKTLWEKEKLLISLSVFKRLVLQTRKNQGLFGKGLTHQQQTTFKNTVGKEEIARNEQFLLFPQCFLLDQKIVSPNVNMFDIISLFAAEVIEAKIGL